MIWGVPTLAFLLVVGIYFSFKIGFYKPKAVIKTVKDTLGSLKVDNSGGISPFAAVATALGGTVGVGSIVGVGYALALGGPGSIFWMWVCSFFGMGIKYSEIKIALNDRQSIDGELLGGAPIRLKKLGYKKLALAFCILCIVASFGTGNLTQIGTIVDFMRILGAKDIISGLVCVGVIALAVFGGRERIAKINTVIVPAASIVYILSCVIILGMNFHNILYAFSLIFKSAFGVDSVIGGFSGAALAHVIREGFARSLFSNEAGMGSSPLAHATASSENSDSQAEWGLFEIFFDTFIVSTLTALCLISCGKTDALSMFVSSFGNIGFFGFGALTAVFAFASVISWCYYAECCLSFIFPKIKIANTVYRVLFATSSVMGVFLSGSTVWEMSDILNALMMFPNIFLLFKCRSEIERMV